MVSTPLYWVDDHGRLGLAINVALTATTSEQSVSDDFGGKWSHTQSLQHAHNVKWKLE